MERLRREAALLVLHEAVEEALELVVVGILCEVVLVRLATHRLAGLAVLAGERQRAGVALYPALEPALASCAEKSNTCSIGDHHASRSASGAGVWNAFIRASHSATTSEEDACLGKSTAGSNVSVVFMTITLSLIHI